MSIDELKTYIEDRLTINFNYDVIDDKKNDNRSDEVYYLRSKPMKSGSWIEIYPRMDLNDGTFNMYQVVEHDILRAWLHSSAEDICGHLKADFNFHNRQSQARLF